jgi:hypothetical protein
MAEGNRKDKKSELLVFFFSLQPSACCDVRVRGGFGVFACGGANLIPLNVMISGNSPLV